MPSNRADDADWYESEGARHSMKRELQRLKRRARSHPIQLLVLAVLLTAAALWYKERRQPPYRAYVILRVTEGAIVDEKDPLAGRDLEEYLSSVALSNEQLLALIEEHDLYRLARARGEIFAIGKLRGAMQIRTVNNYFAEARQYDATARSARISVRYQHEDPQVAYAVARDLSRALVENEQRRREAAAEKLAVIAKATHDRAQAQALALKSQVTRNQLELDEARRGKAGPEEIAALEVEQDRLEALLKRALEMLSITEGKKRSVDLLLAADAADLGLRFRVVDLRPPALRPETTPVQLAMWGLALFVLLLPLSAIAVGAFDTRLHHLEDIERLGLSAVGHVPPFPGHRVGALKSRPRARS